MTPFLQNRTIQTEKSKSNLSSASLPLSEELEKLQQSFASTIAKEQSLTLPHPLLCQQQKYPISSGSNVL
ncbi:hypothetical protein ACFX13_035254 [Malus domestica]